MTIGKSSRKASVRNSIRAPKFLDKPSGFYGRLDEPEFTGEEVKGNESTQDISIGVVEDVELFNEGTVEDDGQSLLRSKPSCRRSRWRKSLREKESKDDKNGPPIKDTSVTDVPRVFIEVEMEKLKHMEEKNQKMGKARKPALAHFSIREEADDQVLIQDRKRGRAEEEDKERKPKREQEEGLKALKRNTVKNYRKVRKICNTRTANIPN